MDSTIYTLMVWTIPVLLSVLAFIGALAVNALMKLANDVNEIKINLGKVSAKHEDLEDRIVRIENKIFA
jgi:hypothetical protein